MHVAERDGAAESLFNFGLNSSSIVVRIDKNHHSEHS
jgi:hypothetical protein